MDARRRGRWVSVLASLALVVTSAACGGDDDDDAATPAPAEGGDWDAVVDAANDEGAVTIYSGQGLDQLNDMATRFESQYPDINVEVVRGVESDLAPRVEAENQTGNGIADIFVSASEPWVQTHAEMDWFVEPVGPNFSESEYNAGELLHEGGAFETNAAILTFGWNTELYPDGLEDYPDLLDPDLRGSIGVPEPTAPSFVDFYLYLEEHYGEDFLEDLAAQEPRIYPSALPMAEALSAGEIGAATFVQVLVDEKEAGAPVDSGLAPEEVWGARFFGMIQETAPHPNAAQLLADFMISSEGQEALSRKNASVLPDIVDEGLAVAFIDDVRRQDLEQLTPEAVADFQAEWNSLFR
jgi:iron(III) transport system substrate-binding protein